jgi:hypothetical protein
MDIKKLEELLDKKDLQTEELFDLFKVKNKKEAVELWKKNLSILKFEWNDELGYDSFSLLYEKIEDFQKNSNIFYLEMMTISLFLRTYCNYDVDIISGFIRMIGILEFCFSSGQILGDMPEYVYYRHMFDEHKKETKNLLEIQRSMEVFESLEKASAEIDMTELEKSTKILADLKKEIVDKNN